MGANAKTPLGKKRRIGMEMNCSWGSVRFGSALENLGCLPVYLREGSQHLFSFIAIFTPVNWIEGIYSADPIVLRPHLTPNLASAFKRNAKLCGEASKGRR